MAEIPVRGDLDAMLRCDDVTYVRAIVKTRASEQAWRMKTATAAEMGWEGRILVTSRNPTNPRFGISPSLSSFFFSGKGKGDG